MDDVKEIIKKLAGEIEKPLLDAFSENKKWLDDIALYQLSTGGKRLRPVLCILTTEALGGKKEDAIPFAVATEVLHNMLIMHDDIEDGDTIRRDKPTAWVKYGLPNGVNTGDYMLAKCYDIIQKGQYEERKKLKLLEIFTFALLKTIEGQALDINYRAKEDFTIEEYMKIATLKTGYYFVLGIVGGAVIAGREELTESLWNFGKYLGPAFQIKDDVLDLTKGKGRGGEIGNDIKEGKPSILFAHLMENAKADDKKKVVEIMKKKREETTKEDVNLVIELYKKYGSIDFAERYAERLIEKAKEEVEQMGLKEERFLLLLDYLIERTK